MSTKYVMKTENITEWENVRLGDEVLRLRTINAELVTHLRSYVTACREQGLNLGPITWDAEEALARAEGKEER